MNYPRNSDDVIDSRDVIETLEALTRIQNDPELPNTNSGLVGDDDIDPGYLQALAILASDGEDYSEDWAYGATLIRDSYFQEYAQELADDLGYMQNPEGQTWPYRCIDWEQAARELQMDYTSIDFDGVTYWIR